MLNIEDIKNEYDNILAQLSNPELVSDWEKFEELAKKKLSIEIILNKYSQLEEVRKEIKESQSLILAKEDPEIVNLAENELSQLIAKEKLLEEELITLQERGLDPEEKHDQNTDPSKKDKHSAAIIEIRAGTGGEEAALFASDLYRMYSRYASLEGFKQKVLDSRATSIGGIKEITFEISDGNVFSKMKYEAGVHRVQRIPSTEKSGRIHTSTATVAVLPKPKKTEIKIRPDELKVDLYRSSGPGGQNVNKRETAVRITHLPTGIVVTSQTERNQLKNKENALSILEAKILEKKQTEEEKALAGERKTQVGGAKRVEKIRTYNFPQDRITDHRLKKNWHHLEEIMDGKLDKIIKTLQKELEN